MDNLGHKRQSYEKHTLDIDDMELNPMDQFAKWYADAEQVNIIEPNAMALATVNQEGIPSVRIVLLKGFASEGFAFYTNYASDKGRQLEENPHAALVFWWDKLQRQIRIQGAVEKLAIQESDKYFQSRPRGSQLSAVASPQSREISKAELEERRKQVEKQYQNEETILRPQDWGGYLLRPNSIEFWQGRENRYHDRLKYISSQNGDWQIIRLAP